MVYGIKMSPENDYSVGVQKLLLWSWTVYEEWKWHISFIFPYYSQFSPTVSNSMTQLKIQSPLIGPLWHGLFPVLKLEKYIYTWTVLLPLLHISESYIGLFTPLHLFASFKAHAHFIFSVLSAKAFQSIYSFGCEWKNKCSAYAHYLVDFVFKCSSHSHMHHLDTKLGLTQGSAEV